MKKKTKKEIEGALRNELAKKHSSDIKNLQERINKLANDYYELQKKYRECNDKRLEAEEKVEQYEDWIRRLQEYCDMPEDTRKQAIEHERFKTVLDGYAERLIPYFNLLSL